MEVSFKAELKWNREPDFLWRIEGSAIVVNGEVLSRQVTAVTEFFIHYGHVACVLVSLEDYRPEMKADMATWFNDQLDDREDWRNEMDVQARGAANRGNRAAARAS
jgi:hypothetical protein